MHIRKMQAIESAQAIQIKPCCIPKPWSGTDLNFLSDRQYKHNIGEAVIISSLEKFDTHLCLEPSISFRQYWQDIGINKLKAIHQDLHNKIRDKQFPFMIKLLSTEQPISVQVHPSSEDMQKIFYKDDLGKYESWLILKASKDSCLYLGLKNKNLVRKFFSLDNMDNCLEYLNQYVPEVGNIYELQPGLVHGTKGKLLLYEIQQPSDYTFRIFDFGRERGLDIKKAQQVIKDVQVRIHQNKKPMSSEFFSLQIQSVSPELEYTVQQAFAVITYLGPRSRFVSKHMQFDLEWGSTILCWNRLSFKILFQEVNNKQKGLPYTEAHQAMLIWASP